MNYRAGRGSRKEERIVHAGISITGANNIRIILMPLLLAMFWPMRAMMRIIT